MNARRVGSLILAVSAIAVVLALPRAARGGPPGDATYLGPTLCLGCHKALHPAAVAGWQKSAHPKAMWSVSSPPEGCQVLGDFSANAPFTKDKIAYVLGTGVRAQAYLDANYQVLPGQWDAKTKAWTPREAADGKTQCIGCHVTGYNAADSTYKAMGVGCEMCHGPGSGHVGSSDKKGTIVNPKDLDAPKRAQVCGQCHSQGKSKDGTHAFPIGFKPGDDLDQVFTYTESVPQGATNAQYDELRFGGGKHLAAGTVCTTCHDPHGGQGSDILRQTPPALCQQCHKDLKGAQHSPEALKAVSCTMCHMPNGSHRFVPPHQG